MQFHVPQYIKDPKERAAIMDRQRQAQEQREHLTRLRSRARQLGVDLVSSEDVQRLRNYIRAAKVPSDGMTLAAARVAADDLGIPVPRVSMVSKSEAIRTRGPGVGGWADVDENEIFIREDLCQCLVAFIAVHECSHRATTFACPGGDTERIAQQYESEFARKFLSGYRCGRCGRLATEAAKTATVSSPSSVHFAQPQVSIDDQIAAIAKLGVLPTDLLFPAFRGPRLLCR